MKIEFEAFFSSWIIFKLKWRAFEMWAFVIRWGFVQKLRHAGYRSLRIPFTLIYVTVFGSFHRREFQIHNESWSKLKYVEGKRSSRNSWITPKFTYWFPRKFNNNNLQQFTCFYFITDLLSCTNCVNKNTSDFISALSAAEVHKKFRSVMTFFNDTSLR